MLVALYSVFNAEDLISESIRSVASQVDEIQVYDGRYEGFKCPCGKVHDNSCDKTAEVVERTREELRVELKYFQLPAMPELEKRTRTLAYLKEKDTGFVIDDDEIFYGSETEFRFFGFSRKYNLGWINVLSKNHARYPSMRVLLKVNGMKYVSNGKGLSYEIHGEHGLLPELNSTESETPSQKRCLFKNCGLVHLSGDGVAQAYRSLQRDRARVAYEEDLLR